MDPIALRLALVAESIDGAGVRIRRYHEEDIPDVRAGCDDPLTQRFLPLLPSPYTQADAAWWVTEGAAAAFSAGGGNFAIADPASDRLIGGIGIPHQRDGAGEIGYWIAPWARQRGVATAATRALTEYAFSAGYGRMQLRTEFENTASQRVAIRAGFLREAVQRAAAIGRDGTRHDLIVWARVIGDPPGPSPRALPDLPGGELTDGVIRLRPVGPSNAAELHAVRVLPEVVDTSVPPRAPTPAETARRCAHAEAAWLAGQQARIVIRDNATGDFVGEIGLSYSEPLLGQAMIGYTIAPAWRRRGYATRAVVLLTRWALNHTEIVRITAGIAPWNTSSGRVLTRAGFVPEGHERGRLPDSAGGRTDVNTYALLRSDVTPP